MPRCLQQYLRSCFCHITNFNAANSEMFWVNTFVTKLLVLFHRGEKSQNKQEEIHLFPSLKFSPRCLQQYLRSCFCHITNFNAANSEMFRVNTFVTELLVLFHRGEKSQNKQEEIHLFPSLKFSKHKIV